MLEAGGSMDDVLAACCLAESLQAAYPCLLLWQLVKVCCFKLLPSTVRACCWCLRICQHVQCSACLVMHRL